MAVPFIKTSFISGEIAPALYGHTDYTRFLSAASTVRNAYIAYQGGTSSRAGTAFVGFSKQTGRAYPPRLITFQFSINQGLCLEFGHRYMRVISDGAFVVESTTAISGISRSNPCVVSDNTHGYSNGDWVFLDNIHGMTELNGKTVVVANATTNAFQIADVYGNLIDSSNFTAYVSGGTAARIYTLVTPYDEADLDYLKFAQSADVMSLTLWNQKTGTDYAPQELSRFADDNWQIAELDLDATIDPPSSVNGTSSVHPTGVSPDQGTAYAYVVTSVGSGNGNESVASARVDLTFSTDIAIRSGAETINWIAVDGAQYYNVYKAPPAFTPIPGNEGYSYPVPLGAVFGYAGFTYGTQFVDTNITADYSQVPPLHENPFAPGQVVNVLVTNSGLGLTAVTWTVTTAAGTGFDGYPVIAGGSMTAFVITNTGKNYQPGDSIAFNGAGFAAGAIDFTVSGNPTAGDTITLNGIVWRFVSTITAGHQTLIQGNLANTLKTLVNQLSAASAAALTVASYTATATALDINYNTAGVAGNAYTLAASAANPGRSGPTLTGGAGSGGTAPAATLEIGPESGTYPGVVNYFQQRRIYAASPNSPDTYWMSQPGAYKNFDSRVPTIDTDAITGNPWSVEVNGVQFLVPMPGGLVVLTGLAAYQLTGTGGSSLNPVAITPSSQQDQPQTYNGCSATVAPIKIDYDIIYLQAKGSIFRDIQYNYYLNIYTGEDITKISSHLFTGYQMLASAWCEEPYKIMWVARNDGTLLSLTYLKAEEVQGWARHDTNGLFLSVTSVTEPPVDALYLAVKRFPGTNTAYMIERMNNRIWATAEDCWCVDSGLSLSQPTPAATLTATSAAGLGALSGIANLVGGSGYSSLTAAVITDDKGQGPGTGAVGNLTIVNGVITAVTINPEGSGYVNPSIEAVDPANIGSGFRARILLDNSTTFIADADVFDSTSVGDVIRMGGGVAKITALGGPRQVTANIQVPIAQVIPNSGGQVLPQPAGSWTMTNPVITVSGLDHLIGETVTGLADGNVITPRVVQPNGSITLDKTASSIIVGLGYQVQLQSVYLEAGSPTTQGQRKKIAQVTARVQASRDFQIGSNQVDGSTLSPMELDPLWANMKDAPNPAQQPYDSVFAPLYTGDVRIPVSDGYQKPGQVALQQNNPLPLSVLAVIPEALSGDIPQTQVQQKGR